MMDTAEKVLDIDKNIKKLSKQRELLVSKALASNDVDDVLFAEARMASLSQNNRSKSYIIDPSSIRDNAELGFRIPLKLDMNVLRAMGKTPLVKAIIGTKVSQIKSYSTESTDNNSIGWRIKKKAKRNNNKTDKDSTKLSSKDKKIIDELSDLILLGGTKDMSDKEPLSQWLSFQTKDSLEIDQAVYEVIRDRAKRVIGWKSTDGSTYRYTDPYYIEKQKGVIKINNEYPKYVQIYDGTKIFSDFYSWELNMGIRNQVTDIRKRGYGVAELEDLVDMVTWMMEADDYNGRFFRQGSSPKGLLLIKNSISSPALNQFRDQFNAQASGVQNSWRSFVLEAENAQWINMQLSNQDMQFSSWGEYLIRMTCAIFKTDPTEVGFHVGNAGASGDGSTSHKQRTDFSKEKGLFPLLQFHQDRVNWFINQYLTSRNIPLDYEFVFTGLSPIDEDKMIEQDVKRVSHWSTINEIRESRGKAPIKGGNIILNSIYLQGLSMSKQTQYVDENGGGSYGDGYNNYGDNNYEDDNEGDNNGNNKEDDNEMASFKSMSSNPILSDAIEWISNGCKPTLRDSMGILLGKK